MKKKYWILLILLLTVLAGGGYMVFKQHTEKEKMIAIAHSEEAKNIYIKHLLQQDKTALSDNGIIKSYEIDDESLEYNPMGGLMVTLIVNKNKKLYLQINILETHEHELYSGPYIISSGLNKLLERN
ncbi:DUF1310 domain-containing protein [Streptococcus uberis]|nr:DUF1310 family protein [Streptococcus uberis]MCK1255343.1 DUF1310 domain-containing protein [Streptococcus uberis]